MAGSDSSGQSGRWWERRSAFWLPPLLAIVVFLPTLGNYFIYDDPIQLQAGRAFQHDGVAVLFGSHFHGHFRPLSTLSFALIDYLVGNEWEASPVPYRVLSIALHAINVLLAGSILVRLGGANGLTLLATMLFAVSWRASEAVTYLSANGMEWSTMGVFIACLGIIRVGQERRWISGLALTLAGMVVALGGGEYGVAGFPILVLLGLWNFRGESLRVRFGRAAAVLLTITPPVALFVLHELVCRNEGRVGTQFTLGPHMIDGLVQNIGNLSFPHLVDEPILCAIVAILFVSLAVFPSGRAKLVDGNFWLLLLMALGALAVFAPSRMGNYGRFQYIAALFFLAWIVQVAWTLLRLRLVSGSRMSLTLATLLIAFNVSYLYVRVGKEAARGDAVQQFVARVSQVAKVKPEDEGRSMQVWLCNDCEHAGILLQHFALIAPKDFHLGFPGRLEPQANEVICFGVYHLRKGFLTRFVSASPNEIEMLGPADGRVQLGFRKPINAGYR